MDSEIKIVLTSIEIGPPESLRAARVELWHRLGEPESVLAGDPAHLEPAAGAPVLAGLEAANRGIQGRAE